MSYFDNEMSVEAITELAGGAQKLQDHETTIETIQGFNAYEDDAAFFAHAFTRREEKARQFEETVAAAEGVARVAVTEVMDRFFPRPEFVPGSVFYEEEVIDVKMLAYDSWDYAEAYVHSLLAEGKTEEIQEVASSVQKEKFGELMTDWVRREDPMYRPDDLQDPAIVAAREAIVLAEAEAATQAVIAQIRLDQVTPPAETGSEPVDRSNMELFEKDQEKQATLGDEFIYFGHTINLDDYLYRALRAGYNPSTAQIEAEQAEGMDFLWDEILQLHADHSDIADQIYMYGYSGGNVSFLGAYAVPEDELADIFTKLHLRGRDYKLVNKWGFPYFTDPIPEEDET